MIRAPDINILRGLPAGQREAAVHLYWQAFGAKLGRLMGPEARALAYFARVLRSDQAVCALDGSGALVGIAGFRTASGSFAHGNRHDMMAVYGRLGAAWRAAAWRLLGAERESWRFQLEGLCVREGHRGYGVGSALIEAICDEARARGHSEVRLDVTLGNSRARALYERAGFTAIGEERLGALALLFGYRGATRMMRQV